MHKDLAATVESNYPATEFPGLADQVRRWRVSRPLSGLRVLDATPVFANTMAKYLALISAGASVTVSAHRGIPGDPQVIELLPGLGIQVANEASLAGGFDVVFDCAGTHTDVRSHFGYVELTRSGVPRYADCRQPVFLADAGRIKLIETTLGTGDGFVRGLEHFGYALTPGRSVAVVGGGKVGLGIAAASRAVGADVTVIDIAKVTTPPGCTFVDGNDPQSVRRTIGSSWCVVAATGQAGALSPFAAVMADAQALLANMGAEDEFGPDVPDARILNDRVAINFALPEPTRLRYLDPTMALSNAGAVELVEGRVSAGVQPPSAELEEEILAVVREHGAIGSELDVCDGLSRLRP